MNRSLFARTRREFYAKAIRVAREHGASEAEIEAQLAEDIGIAKSLLAGKCPNCGEPIARFVDYERQQGESAMPGAWVQYRCSTDPPPGKPGLRPCGFMIDLKEGDATN